MAYSTPLVHAIASSSTGNNATTPSRDTTGADLIVLVIGWFRGITLTISDSTGANTYTRLTAQDSGTGPQMVLAYCQAPTTSATHTVTAATAGGVPFIAMAAFSGSSASPLDQQNGGHSVAAASQATGSITPGQDNELIIAGVVYDVGTTISPDSGMTITDQAALLDGTAYGGALAYKIQTTAAAINETFSWTGAANTGASIGSFKASATATGYGILLSGSRNRRVYQ